MNKFERFQANSWREPSKPSRRRRVTFAKAVYCAGVDTWFIRLGRQHGIDIMYAERSEQVAKHKAKLINQSLNRDLRLTKNSF